MMNELMKFLRDEEGATAIEYGLIVGLIAIVIIAALGVVSGGLNSIFNKAGEKLNSAATAAG